MNDWREVKLGEFAEINPRESIAKGKIAKKVPMEAVESFTKKIASYSSEEYKGGVKFKNGDTLIARITPSLENGKTAFVDILDEVEVGFGSTEFIVLREIKDLSDKHYLYYLAISPELREIAIQSMTGTSGRQRVQTNVVVDYEFLLPPLPEQKAIAEVLSSLDDKIDLLHRQNETLEQMAQTLFRQWFVERRPELAEGEADESWEVKKLNKLVTIQSSKRIFYKEYKEYGIPFYRSKEIIELVSRGKTNSELFISEERFNEISSQYGAPQEGDILLTSVGTLGRSYRVKEKDLFYFKDGNLTWFKDFKNLSSAIIYTWLNSKFGQDALREITIGSTQSALTLTGLRNIDLPIPSKKIQKELNEHLELIYRKIDKNFLQIQTLEKLRDTLLPKLMSGEIRVSQEL